MAGNVSKLIKVKGNHSRYNACLTVNVWDLTGVQSGGTYIPITINKTFKERKKLLMCCNKYARIIFGVLRDEYCDANDCTLVSEFFKQAKVGLKPVVKMLVWYVVLCEGWTR